MDPWIAVEHTKRTLPIKAVLTQSFSPERYYIKTLWAIFQMKFIQSPRKIRSGSPLYLWILRLFPWNLKTKRESCPLSLITRLLRWHFSLWSSTTRDEFLMSCNVSQIQNSYWSSFQTVIVYNFGFLCFEVSRDHFTYVSSTVDGTKNLEADYKTFAVIQSQ